jgi:hypothetical protein
MWGIFRPTKRFSASEARPYTVVPWSIQVLMTLFEAVQVNWQQSVHWSRWAAVCWLGSAILYWPHQNGSRESFCERSMVPGHTQCCNGLHETCLTATLELYNFEFSRKDSQENERCFVQPVLFLCVWFISFSALLRAREATEGLMLKSFCVG